MFVLLKNNDDVFLPKYNESIGESAKSNPVIVLSPSSNTSFVTPIHPKNAEDPISVTELGMVTEVKPVQFSNAKLLIDVTQSPMVTDFRDSLPLKNAEVFLPKYNESIGESAKSNPVIVLSPSSNTSFVSPEQLKNAEGPISVTELGMVTEVKRQQFLNAPEPIEVTELPMVTEVKPLQL